MTAQSLLDSRALRVIAFTVGAGAIIAAFLADRLPGRVPDGFGPVQVAMLVFGSICLAFAALGSRVGRAHTALAVILLNTVLLLIALELGAASILRVLPEREGPRPPLGPYYYYRGQPWAADLNREHLRVLVSLKYEPYAMWKRAPFTGTVMNVDARGNRVTPKVACGAPAFTVFAFGGSTMFGSAVPDWATIPAYLQGEVTAATGRATCIVNFGEPAFISTQSVILLMRELQAGRRPDLVVFYDGINEALAALQTGLPGLHMDVDRVAARLQAVQPVVRQRLLETKAVELAGRVLGQPLRWRAPARFPRPTVNNRELADSVVAVYLENYRIVEGMANAYGFRFAFFWQPAAATMTGKPLTTEEQYIVDHASRDFVQVLAAAGERVEAAVPSRPHLFDLRGVFDAQRDPIFFDSYHVLPQGNQLIARAMVRHLSAGGHLKADRADGAPPAR